MKALKTGYVLVFVFLLVYSVTLGISAFNPIPKRLDYPQYSLNTTLDFNSPQYKEEQQKYQQDMKAYQENNKDNETNRRIWGENIYMICLVAAVLFLIAGVLISQVSVLVGASLLFAGLILIVAGQGIATYQADSSSIPLVGQNTKIDITPYKQKQFYIVIVGAVCALVLGFTKFIRSTSSLFK